MKIISDNPIQKSENDILGRDIPARSFVKQVLALDASEGVVVGILGEWGSGKTSFINLTRQEFNKNDIPVLDFNPWMFSGTRQLLETFFIELSTQLKIRTGLTNIGKDLESFGNAFTGIVWLPIAGPWLERLSSLLRIISSFFKNRDNGIQGHREKLEKKLLFLNKPIVVILDDIDRLTTNEIRDIFKLIRLTASFPNIIYVVAFDRIRIEEALSEQRIPGRQYLEKILQVSIDLPSISEDVLIENIFSSIYEAIPDLEQLGSFNQQLWPDIFMDIIRPLIRNIRDVRRYVSALHITVPDLEEKIELVDIFALEAIRVFLPDVFIRLHSSIDCLTYTPSNSANMDRPEFKEKIESLIQAAGDDSEIIKSMISRLFPAASGYVGGSHHGIEWKVKWLRNRRVAHEDYLRYYLERSSGKSLKAFTSAEHAFELMDDYDAFYSYLKSLDKNIILDVIGLLETFEDSYESIHVIPGAISLLNILPELPEKPRTMLSFDTKMVVTRVVYRLLRSLKNEDEISQAVNTIIQKIYTLSSKLEVILTVGYKENRGHRLVTEEVANDLERNWRDEVRSTTPDNHDFTKEYNLLWVYLMTKRDSCSTEEKIMIPDKPEITLTLLKSAKSEVIGHSFESRAVSRSPRLFWDSLIEIYGDEVILKERINKLKKSGIFIDDELLSLVNKYVSGWRPKEFGDDE